MTHLLGSYFDLLYTECLRPLLSSFGSDDLLHVRQKALEGSMSQKYYVARGLRQHRGVTI